MRVVVVGATGNVGTSVLRALGDAAEVESVLGIARRAPKEPWPKVEWARADITQDDLAFLALPGQVAVYLPFSYSMAGTLLLVQRDRVERVAIDSASIMALVVSGGVSRAVGQK